MKKIYLIIIVLVWLSTGFSQDSEDSILELGYSSLEYLIPTNSYGEISNAQVLTNSNIPNKNEHLTLQFIIYPSFEKISVTSILSNDKGNSYRIANCSSKKELIKSKKRHVSTKYRPINKDIVLLVNNIFEKFLIETHYSKGNKNFNGMDGTTYQFYVNGTEYGQMYGETWSPQEGTNTDYLVKITGALVQYTFDKINEDELMATIEKFNNKISLPQLSQYEYYGLHSMCDPDSEMAAPIVAYGSIALHELAQDKGIEDYQVGGILTIWRLKACDLLEEEHDLFQSTIEAIEKECINLIEIKGSSEKDFILEAKKYLQDYEASIAVLSWAIKPNKNEPAQHIVIASDGIEEMRVEYKGYGRNDSRAKTSCVKSGQGALKFYRY